MRPTDGACKRILILNSLLHTIRSKTIKACNNCLGTYFSSYFLFELLIREMYFFYEVEFFAEFRSLVGVSILYIFLVIIIYYVDKKMAPLLTWRMCAPHTSHKVAMGP